MQTGQPAKATSHLEHLVAAADGTEQRLEQLCSLADAQVRATPCRVSLLGGDHVSSTRKLSNITIL